MDLKRFKKVLTHKDTRDNILKLIRNKRKFEKNHKKNKTKKFLTNRKQHDKISELLLEKRNNKEP